MEEKYHTLDEYRLIPKILGEGAVGTCYKALDKNDQVFCIKVSNCKQDDENIENEWETYLKLDHPHICKMYKHNKNSVITYIDGQ